MNNQKISKIVKRNWQYFIKNQNLPANVFKKLYKETINTNVSHRKYNRSEIEYNLCDYLFTTTPYYKIKAQFKSFTSQLINIMNCQSDILLIKNIQSILEFLEYIEILINRRIEEECDLHLLKFYQIFCFNDEQELSSHLYISKNLKYSKNYYQPTYGQENLPIWPLENEQLKPSIDNEELVFRHYLKEEVKEKLASLNKNEYQKFIKIFTERCQNKTEKKLLLKRLKEHETELKQVKKDIDYPLARYLKIN